MSAERDEVVIGGSLSDYVAGKLQEVANQRAEAERQRTETERQTALVRDHMIQAEAQRMSELRACLLDPTTVTGRLFGRFRVLELLEEVQSKYWRNSKINVLGPGLALTKEVEGFIRVGVYEERMTNPGFYSRSMVGIDHAPTVIAPSYGSVLVGHKRVFVRDVKTMTVEAVRSELTGPELNYDLMYSYYLRRIDLSILGAPQGYRNYSESGSQIRLGTEDGDWYLTPRTRIRSDQSPEVLKQIIGEELVRELGAK